MEYDFYEEVDWAEVVSYEDEEYCLEEIYDTEPCEDYGTF